MRRLRVLTGRHRTPSINRWLGFLLAFVAGAVNAGGFLVVHLYTSHMTGFVSMLADHLVLGNMTLVLGAIGALLAFVCGAATTAIIVNWSRQRGLHAGYALPLLLEAALLLLFGLVGATTLNRATPFAVPFTVLLLAFLMGLQNALVSKVSSSQIRTTHMTGVITTWASNWASSSTGTASARPRPHGCAPTAPGSACSACCWRCSLPAASSARSASSTSASCGWCRWPRCCSWCRCRR